MLHELSPDQWRRLEPHLDRLLDLDRAARSDALSECIARERDIAVDLERALAACVAAETTMSGDERSAAATYSLLLAASLAAAPAIVGDTYRLDERIGIGGIATVYRATDLRRSRSVAVKLVSRTLTSHIERARFRAEIEIAGRLSHPYILPVFDSGETDQVLFYVVPLLAAGSLRERLLEGPLPPPVQDALRLIVEVAAALDYSHGQGIVHRDIKPENILLHEGHAIVADFGIARAICPDVAAADFLRTTGHVVGTPAYMSPEQWSTTGTIDGRSDIYSLGRVLGELLSGVAPVAPIVDATRGGEGGADEWIERCPPHLADLVHRATAQRPEDRFQTARELSDAIAAHR